MRRGIVVLILVAFLFGDSPAWGDASALPIRPGDRVRVSLLEREPATEPLFLATGLEPGGRLTGRFVFADTSGVAIDDEQGFARTIPNPLVARLEVSGGRKGNAGRGALIGLAAGAVAGLVMGNYLANTEDFGEAEENGKATVRLGMFLGGVLVGTGVGAIVGGSIHNERWHRGVPFEPGDTR